MLPVDPVLQSGWLPAAEALRLEVELTVTDLLEVHPLPSLAVTV